MPNVSPLGGHEVRPHCRGVTGTWIIAQPTLVNRTWTLGLRPGLNDMSAILDREDFSWLCQPLEQEADHPLRDIPRHPSPNTNVTDASEKREEFPHSRPTPKDVVIEDRPRLGTKVRRLRERWLNAIRGRVLDKPLVVLDLTEHSVKLQYNKILHGLGVYFLVRQIHDLQILPPCKQRHPRIQLESITKYEGPRTDVIDHAIERGRPQSRRRTFPGRPS